MWVFNSLPFNLFVSISFRFRLGGHQRLHPHPPWRKNMILRTLRWTLSTRRVLNRECWHFVCHTLWLGLLPLEQMLRLSRNEICSRCLFSPEWQRRRQMCWATQETCGVHARTWIQHLVAMIIVSCSRTCERSFKLRMLFFYSMRIRHFDS